MTYINYSAHPVANQESQNNHKNNPFSVDPLGTNTKSSSFPENKGFQAESVKQDLPQETRAERYIIQSVARNILYEEGKKEGLEFPANYHRTAKCKHTRIDHQVGVHKSQKHNKAFYSGLSTCGNIWVCPVCAVKVQERRRQEIAKAFDWAYSNNKKVIMITFTFPHYSFDKLADLLKKQTKAYTHLRSGEYWVKLKKEIGFTGLIRALELTKTDNGWHPHTHEAWIVDKNIGMGKLKYDVINKWTKSCIKSGLLDESNQDQMNAFFLRSVDITDNCSTSDYLAKQDDSKHWGADRELSKASTKTSKKGLHPFGILKLIGESNHDKPNQGRLVGYFLEYVKAMKNKRQHFWTHGLKILVGVDEKTDKELAELEDDKADLLTILTPKEWDLVKELKAKTIILDIAENKGADAVMLWFYEHTTISLDDLN